MAQVPYSPIPDVQTQYAATPTKHEDTPLQAFGGATAEALTRMGQVDEKASDELFTRAQAMQSLKNEADARQNSVDYTLEADKLSASFATKLNGDAGPEALAAYHAQLADLRNQYRDKLGNAQAQQMYDAESFRVFTHNAGIGAAHSAQQLKSYAATTNTMAIEATKNATLAHPEDEANFKANLDKVAENETNNGHLSGLNGDQIEQNIRKQQSDLTKKRIDGLLNTNQGEAARKTFDDAAKKDLLVGSDTGEVEKKINSYENVHGSRAIVDGIRDGTSFAMGNGKVGFDKWAQAEREIESSGNYSLLQGADGHRKIGAYSILEPYFKDYLKAGGLSPNITPEEFIKHPEWQDQVAKAVFDDGIAKGHTANDIAGRWQQGHYAGEGADVVDSNGVDRADYLRRFNAALYKNSSLDERKAAALAKGKEVSPDNPELPDHIESRVVSLTSQEEHEKRLQADTDQYTVNATIQEQLGKGPLTIDALKAANPDFGELYDKMSTKEQTNLTRRLAAMSRTDYSDSPERSTNFDRLTGLAWVSPEDFRGVDLSKENLNTNQNKVLLGLQKQVLAKGALEDPAMGYLAQNSDVKNIALNAGIDPSEKGKTEWHKYLGALSQDVELARAQGKNLGPSELQEMAKKAAATRSETAGFFGFGAKKEYEIPIHSIPEKEQARYREFLISKGNKEPTDQEIVHLYAAKLYQDTFKKGQDVANR